MNELVRWFEPKDKKDPEEARVRATHLIGETAQIETRQSSWHELNLWNATLFSNRELVGFRWGEVLADRELWPINLRTENLIEEIGESMLSKASSSPLKPTLVPHGMSIKTDRAVRLLDSFLFGVWRQLHAEEACLMMFLDAYLSGMGMVRVAFDKKTKELSLETVFFDNVIIDNRETANRTPPRTYRIRQVLPKAAVEAKYGVSLGDSPRYVDYREIADGWVVLVEAWRLPDASGKGGYHAVACADKLLVDEEYEHDWVPLVHFKWTDMPTWFGKSGVEQLVPFQNRQNELNDTIEIAQGICCHPQMLVNANSMIDPQQWDGQVGRFYLWSGVEPKPFSWQTNLNELYHERERNRKMAYSHVGMSEMFANADVPQGVRLDSSAGVREFRNMEDARHLRLWTRFENARLEVARLILKVLANSQGAEAFTSYYHPGGSKASAKEIPYQAVKDLTDDDYSWTLEAVPLSSMSPAARRELIRDWSSRGLIDTDEARMMEGNPNLERDETLEMQSVEDIKRHIGILEDGDYEPPTEITNIKRGIKDVTANYFRLLNYEDVEKEVLANHLEWLIAAQNIAKKVAMEAMQQQMAIQSAMTPFAPTQGMAGTSSATSPAAAPNAA